VKRLFYLGIAAILALSLSGCGSADSHDTFIARIFSDQQADGDIAFDSVVESYTVTNGPNTIFFGIDDADRNLAEFRSFLDFPLDGSSDGGVVPLNARIVSATLEVFVDEVSFASTIPALLDLVQFSITGLIPADFDSSPLQFPDGTDATLNFDFFSSDEDKFVRIDVTSLMRETMRRELDDFQVRFLLDFGANAGLVGIEDQPNITMTAPLLTVKYR
jgi:hypothetical protein